MAQRGFEAMLDETVEARTLAIRLTLRIW